MGASYFYHERKRLHLCTRCGKKDARTLIGRALCFECAEKQYPKGNKEELAKRAEYMRQRAEQARAKGLCPQCGKRKPAEGRVHCEHCLAIRKRYDERIRRKRGQMPRSMMVELGMCYTCFKPVVPGKKLCPECLEKAMKNLKQNRNAVSNG